MGHWLVYLLYNTKLKITYVGITNNFEKRIRQHNGEIKGGAKNTRRGKGFWECRAQIKPLTHKQSARIEPMIKKATGLENRIKKVISVCDALFVRLL